MEADDQALYDMFSISCISNVIIVGRCVPINICGVKVNHTMISFSL